ncbi:MAG: AAA family ATPase [Actinocatenispora sp.]
MTPPEPSPAPDAVADADGRTVVLVNGFSGAGKSTLARRLSRALGLPLYSKDVIKETLADHLGEVYLTDGAEARRLGAAASETMWSLTADSPAGCVLESAWLGTAEYAVAGLTRAGVRTPLEVWCDVPVDLARRRVAQRWPRHPVHVGEPHSAERWAYWASVATPLALGPVYRVDTSGPVDLGPVLSWIEARRPVG